MFLTIFSKNPFILDDEKTNAIVEELKKQREDAGIPDRAGIFKAHERKQTHTKTVYPKDWNTK